MISSVSTLIFIINVKNGGKNVPNFQVGIPVAEKIVGKGDSPFLVFLCIFPDMYKIPGLDPIGLIFL